MCELPWCKGVKRCYFPVFELPSLNDFLRLHVGLANEHSVKESLMSHFWVDDVRSTLLYCKCSETSLVYSTGDSFSLVGFLWLVICFLFCFFWCIIQCKSIFMKGFCSGVDAFILTASMYRGRLKILN